MPTSARKPERFRRGILHGLSEDEFVDLDPAMKRKFIGLLARVGEASYRRGVQQALAMSDQCALPANQSEVANWRYADSRRARRMRVGYRPGEREVVRLYFQSAKGAEKVETLLFEQNRELRRVGLHPAPDEI